MKVCIADGCILCGLCEADCPEVFTVSDICVVKSNVNLEDYRTQIENAEEDCPQGVIRVVEEG